MAAAGDQVMWSCSETHFWSLVLVWVETEVRLEGKW